MKALTNRPLRPHEGRFVRVVQQFACEVFERTAVGPAYWRVGSVVWAAASTEAGARAAAPIVVAADSVVGHSVGHEVKILRQ